MPPYQVTDVFKRMVLLIHTDGFRIPIYDKTILDSIGQTQLWTFKERIDWICLVLKVYFLLLYVSGGH